MSCFQANPQGLCAGVALEGATLREDLHGNATLYGKKLENSDIVTKGVRPPKAAAQLLARTGQTTGSPSAASPETIRECSQKARSEPRGSNVNGRERGDDARPKSDRYPWAVTAHPRDQAFDAERSASVCDGSPAALGSPEVPDVAS